MFTAPDAHVPYIIQLLIMSIQPENNVEGKGGGREKEGWGGRGETDRQYRQVGGRQRCWGKEETDRDRLTRGREREGGG